MRNIDSKLFTMNGQIEHTHGLFNEHGYFDEANATLTRMVGERLMQAYPGHPWGVCSEIEHGVIKISLQGFNQWCHVIKVERLKGDPAMKVVLKAAGEMLERFKMPRKGFDMASWMAANKKYPSHFNRFTKPPV